MQEEKAGTTKKIGNNPTYPPHPGVPNMDLDKVKVCELVWTDLFRHHARCNIITILHKRKEAERKGPLKRHPIDALVDKDIIKLEDDNNIDEFCAAFILWYDKLIEMPRAQRDMIQLIGMEAYQQTVVDIQRKKVDEKGTDKRKRKDKQ